MMKTILNRWAPHSTSLFTPSALLSIRSKTYYIRPSKQYKRFTRFCNSLGPDEPRPTRPLHQLETKFYKVVNGMKIYKNVSNGCRHRRHPTRFHLKKGPPIARLSIGKRSTGGRNKSGQVVVRGRGGGAKRRIRFVDFKREQPGPHEVMWLEYDPNRSADLCLLKNLSTNEYSYIIHPKDVVPGDILYSFSQGIPPPREGEEPIPKYQLMKPGNCFMLKDIPVGTTIHNVGFHAGGPAQISRSAGTSAQLLFTAEKGFAQVRMNSKEVRLIPVEAIATIGTVGNGDHQHRVLGKAGARRRMGRRPKVRGIAMSPYDHPHGGGRKSKGNKDPRSPWGWKCKGRKTVLKKKPFILISVRKARMMKK